MLVPITTSTTSNNPSTASSTIGRALKRFQAAEAGGESRLSGVTLQGSVRRMRLGNTSASFIWLADGTADIEVIIRTRLRGTIPRGLSQGQRVEVHGTIKRYRGSAPQIEASSLRVASQLPDHRPIAIPHAAMHSAPQPQSFRPLPQTLSTLALLTSPTSAALEDVLHVARIRAPWVRIVVCPAPMQGEGAADSMIAGILRLHMQPGIDAILLVRGGASVPADLAPFSESALLRTIRLSQLPIFTAIGHAGDCTPADQAATASFATPSLAAVSLLPDREAIRTELDTLAERIQRRLSTTLFSQAVVGLLSATPPAPPVGTGGRSPAEMLHVARQRLQQAVRQLEEWPASATATPAFLYAVSCDMCLARAILAMPPTVPAMLGPEPGAAPSFIPTSVMTSPAADPATLLPA